MNNPEKILNLASVEKENLWKIMPLSQLSVIPPSLAGLLKHELNAAFFLTINKPNELCHFLNVNHFSLEEIMANPGYHTFKIARRKGSSREIFSPSKQLKSIQKRINYYTQAYYLCLKPMEVHGFVINPHYLRRSCNIVANASQHVGMRYMLNIDLEDFFPSISARQVRDLFKSDFFRFSDQIAYALTLLTTYKGKLPVGTPTSPVISNFICYSLDKDLITFSKDLDLTYSRYADDMTFSSNDPLTSQILEKVKVIVESHGFRINNKKVRFAGPNRRKSVTGITVSEKVNVERKLLKKIRAMTHDMAVNGKELAATRHFNLNIEAGPEQQEKFMNRLTGYIDFIGQVRGRNDPLFFKYKEILSMKPLE